MKESRRRLESVGARGAEIRGEESADGAEATGIGGSSDDKSQGVVHLLEEQRARFGARVL